VANHASPPPLRRVLVHDQDVAVRQALAFSLALEGYSVEAFGAPDTLLTRLRADSADAVIIGHAPPDIRAPLIAQRVRSLVANAAVVITATNPSAELRRNAHLAHAALTEKPLLGDALLETLKAALAA
jgi:DNA-binding NtrC family response regulator